MNLENCAGYKKLLAAVEQDEERSKGFHDYRGKLDWIVARANHYAEKTGIAVVEILDKWESLRTYWYMNYYQDSNQPLLNSEKVKVFDTKDEFLKNVGKEFRCPACDGITTDPYECNSGIKTNGRVCDWKVYGLFKDMGKGVFVFIKEAMHGERIFKPVAWERSNHE